MIRFQLFINDIEVEGVAVDIAVTLRSFSVGEIGSRKGSFSNVFSIPRTNHNAQIFSTPEVIISGGRFPYVTNPARCLIDGVLIFEGTAVLKEASQDYRVFFQTGNSDFFKAIGSLSILDLDINEFDHPYTPQEVANRRVTTEGFVYPNVDFGYWKQATGPDLPHIGFNPFFYAHTILERAIEQLGYVPQGGFFQGDVWKKSAISTKGAIPNRQAVEYRFNQFPAGTITGTVAPLDFPILITDDFTQYDEIPSIEAGRKYFDNLPGINASITITAEFTNTSNFSRAYRFSVLSYRKSTGGFISQEDGPFFSFTGGQRRRISSTFALRDTFPVLGELVHRFVITTSVPSALNSIASENLSFKIEQIIPRSVEFPIRYQNTVPDLTAGDILLTLSNYDGVFFQVDENLKTVEAKKYSDIISNFGAAKNWSEKLDITERPQISFAIEGLSRKNLLTYKNDEKDPVLQELQPYGLGVILVENENLLSEKTSFESKFALIPFSSTLSNGAIMGAIFTGEKWGYDSTNTWTFQPEAPIQGFVPRIGIAQEIDAEINVSGATNPESNIIITPLLFADAVSENYGLIRQILDDTKTVRALFLLDVADVEQIDFTIPVYVDYFGEYFYIEEIEQFKLNKRESCWVKLVRI
jgi:hypothetical protein